MNVIGRFCILTLTIFQAPLMGVDIYAHWLFCTQLDAQQLLFETFPNIKCNFCVIHDYINIAYIAFSTFAYPSSYVNPFAPLYLSIFNRL